MLNKSFLQCSPNVLENQLDNFDGDAFTQRKAEELLTQGSREEALRVMLDAMEDEEAFQMIAAALADDAWTPRALGSRPRKLRPLTEMYFSIFQFVHSKLCSLCFRKVSSRSD